MRAALNLVGVVLMVGGIFVLSYQGYHYTKQEEIAKIGDIKVTGETVKTVHFPPLLGGLSIAAGVIVLVVANFRKK